MQVIQLQQSVTNHLRPATMDDTFVDFEALVRAADISKMKAVHALQELYMRMDSAESQNIAPHGMLPSPPATPRQTVDMSNSSSPSPPVAPYQPPLPFAPYRAATDPQEHNMDTPSKIQTTQPMAPSASAQSYQSPHSTTAESNHNVGENASVTRLSRQSTAVAPSIPDLLRRASDTKTTRRSSFFGGLLKRRSCQSEACATLSEEGPQLNIRSSLHSPSVSMRSETSQTPYNGYCKGAYYLQVGLLKKGMTLRNQPMGITGQCYYWACCSSKCCFEGPAIKAGKSWDFEEHIWAGPGIQFRWSLLAKSHVPIKRAKKRMFDYKCMICEAQKKSSDIFNGIQGFIGHIVQHSTENLDHLMIPNLRYITGRHADADELFDVNFTGGQNPSTSIAPVDVQRDKPTGSENPPVWGLDEDAVFGKNPW